MRGALLQYGCKEEDLSKYILSIDKLKKIKLKGVVEEIAQKNLDVEKTKKAIEVLSSSSFDQIKKLATHELLLEGIKELEDLVYLTKRLEVNTRINFSLSRGLDIYTGNIWEVYESNELVSSSIGAGGRYNRVIAEYMEVDEEVPAVGISFGITPILACLKDSPKKQSYTQLLIAPLEEDIVPIALELAKQYREKGKNTEISYDFQLKKAFKYCDTKEITELIVLGGKDIEMGRYTLKNLKSKETQEIIF